MNHGWALIESHTDADISLGCNHEGHGGGFSGPGLPDTLRRTSVPVAHCLPLLCFGKQH